MERRSARQPEHSPGTSSKGLAWAVKVTRPGPTRFFADITGSSYSQENQASAFIFLGVYFITLVLFGKKFSRSDLACKVTQIFPPHQFIPSVAAPTRVQSRATTSLHIKKFPSLVQGHVAPNVFLGVCSLLSYSGI